MEDLTRRQLLLKGAEPLEDPVATPRVGQLAVALDADHRHEVTGALEAI